MYLIKNSLIIVDNNYTTKQAVVVYVRNLNYSHLALLQGQKTLVLGKITYKITNSFTVHINPQVSLFYMIVSVIHIFLVSLLKLLSIMYCRCIVLVIMSILSDFDGIVSFDSLALLWYQIIWLIPNGPVVNDILFVFFEIM